MGNCSVDLISPAFPVLLDEFKDGIHNRNYPGSTLRRRPPTPPPTPPPNVIVYRRVQYVIGPLDIYFFFNAKRMKWINEMKPMAASFVHPCHATGRLECSISGLCAVVSWPYCVHVFVCSKLDTPIYFDIKYRIQNQKWCAIDMISSNRSW